MREWKESIILNTINQGAMDNYDDAASHDTIINAISEPTKLQ